MNLAYIRHVPENHGGKKREGLHSLETAPMAGRTLRFLGDVYPDRGPGV